MFDFVKSLIRGKERPLGFRDEVEGGSLLDGLTLDEPSEQENIEVQEVSQKTGERTLVPAGSHRVIESVNQLPTFDEILTLPGKAMALGESQRAKLAAVSAGSSVLIFVEPESHGKVEHMNLRAEALKTGKNVSTMRVRQSVILHLYNKTFIPGAKDRQERSSDEVAPSIQLFSNIAKRAAKMNASDMHFCLREDSDSCAVLFRVAGRLRRVDSLPFKDGLDAVAASYGMAEDGSTSEPTFNLKAKQSCAIPINLDGRDYKLRFQSTDAVGGMDAVYRLTLDDLGIKSGDDGFAVERDPRVLGYAPSQCRELQLAARKSFGVILICGVTGSGKSTTMRMLMTLDPHHLEKKLYMIEQPVEARVRGVTHMYIQQSEKGSSDDGHSNPYAAAMRTVLRLDPDGVGVGEVRDEETGSLLKTMTHSGHQVLATLHTNGAIASLERLVSNEIGLYRQTIGARGFLSALIYQRLIPLLCPHCKLDAAEHMEPATAEILEKKYGMDITTIRMRNLKGCKRCEKGLQNKSTVVAEVILPDSTFLKHVRDDEDTEAEQYWRSKRVAPFTDEDCTGKTAFEHGLYKVHLGLIDPEDLEIAFEPFDTYEVFPIKGAN